MIGIVADDITGANDIDIMYAKAGLRTDVYPLVSWDPAVAAADRPDVLVIDTNSRLDSPEEAYRKVTEATRSLREAGCVTFINKTCSVFRGNIGPEFDAMLDTLGASFAVVVLGFPKNGRTTLGGVHYVHGKLLEESEFRRDPVHPMTESNLVSILQKQTKRRVGLVPIEVVEQGPDALRAEIDRMRSRCSYLILDVRDQDSLRIIAKAVRDEPILCGSSALSEESAALLVSARVDTATVREMNPSQASHSVAGVEQVGAAGQSSRPTKTEGLADFGGSPEAGSSDWTSGLSAGTAASLAQGAGREAAAGPSDAPAYTGADEITRPSEAGGVLCAAGSLMPQTAAQIAFAIRNGVEALELDSLVLLQPEARESHVERLIAQASTALLAGRDVLLHASNDPDKVSETKRIAMTLGSGNTDISRVVSEALSSAVAKIADRTGQRKLLVAGGETSAAVCAALGVRGLRLLREIEPGLPSCLAIGGTPYELVLKSGSFGSESFFVKAIRHLRETSL